MKIGTALILFYMIIFGRIVPPITVGVNLESRLVLVFYLTTTILNGRVGLVTG